VGQQASHLVGSEDDGDPRGPLGSDDPVQHADLLPQDISIQEDQCTQGLGLSRGTDLLLQREMREECIELLLAHLGWVSDLVEENVSADPVHVRLLGSRTVVARSDRLPDLRQQLRLARRRVIQRPAVATVGWGRGAWNVADVTSHQEPSMRGSRLRSMP
jgi:hypothetical protein